jgi:hypothetical protein
MLYQASYLKVILAEAVPIQSDSQNMYIFKIAFLWVVFLFLDFIGR